MTVSTEKNIKAVALDMDGTMFNSEKIYDAVGQAVLSKRGYSFTNELKLKMMGLPHDKAFQVMKDFCQLDDSIEELANEAHAVFFELMPNQIETMPGLEALLEKIESHGLPKAVATSSTREIALAALEKFALTSRFEFVLTSESVTHGKPHPEIYLTAAKRFKIAPAQMLVIEDSETGSRAAAASGAVTIAIPESHSAGADFGHVSHVVDRLDSDVILNLLKDR